MVAESGRPNGILVAVGGAEDTASDIEILRSILDLAGKDDARVEVIPTAGDDPRAVGDRCIDAFDDIDHPNVGVMDVRTRGEAARERYVERARAADLFYFTGGDPVRLCEVLGGSPVLDAIQERYREGAVVVGAGSAASALPATLTVRGVASATGLGLLHGAVIDPRFLDRGRFDRLLEIVAANPTLVGLGLGEDSGLVIRGGRAAEAIGPGLVVVVDGRELRSNDAARAAASGRPVVMENMVVHTLAEGYGYDLEERRYVAPRSEEKKVEA